jgi:PAS domain S-box-containing protein
MPSASPDPTPPPPPAPDLSAQLQALRRVALAVARPGGAALYDELAAELAAALEAAVVFVAVYDDESRATLRSLALSVDGQACPAFRCAVRDTPCESLGTEFVYVAAGVSDVCRSGAMFGGDDMDAFAAYPLLDRDGEPIGLLAAMDRRPVGGGDAAHAEAMLKVVAGRVAAEVERRHTEALLHDTSLAVSDPHGGTVFEALVRLLAETLKVEEAFIARPDDQAPGRLRLLARVHDGHMTDEASYDVAGTPCEGVLGRSYRVYPRDLGRLFPDEALHAQALEAYAGYPLTAEDGRVLGLLAVTSRRPLARPDRVEAMLKLVAVRVVAEIERLDADAALARSEASYRAIFEAAEDAILIHDWETGSIVDVNPKACEALGYTRHELIGTRMTHFGSGVAPYDGVHAARWMQLAKLGRCPPFQWRRRNKDGSLHWDEVRLKPVQVGGRPRVLSFSRDVTELRASIEALQAQEQKYRAIFDGSVDSMVLWDDTLTVADVNDAFVRLVGLERADVVGKRWDERPDADDLRKLLPRIRRALAGHEERAVETVTRADGSPFDIELRYLPVHIGGARFALGVGRDVTQALEHERELQRRSARLRATVEAAFDAVIGMDGEGRIVEFNAAAERIFGHRREDAVGQSLADLLLPDRHRAAHERGLRQYRETRRGPMIGRLVETTARRADGTEIPVELAISVAEVPEGSIFVGHLRDITERQRADRALRDSEAQYRAIFNASADALVLRAADFSIVDCNATYELMSGYRRSEVLGVSRVLANPPDVGARIRALHERALDGEPIALEAPLVRRDGLRYDLELRGVPILHRGEPHVLYIGRDITSRRRSDEALRASEEQYRAMFAASADALVLRDAEFRAVEVNPAYTALTGWTREDVLSGTRVLWQTDEAQQQRHLADHARVLAGEALRLESAARYRDGREGLIEVRGTPVSYRGRPHVLYAMRDITERHAAEQRRIELERQLRQAQKMEAIGQLTGGIAHDFNNILASVIGYLVLAEERAETIGDATLGRQLGQAHLAADRARELIAQMLAFARRQRGERRVLALAPLVRQTLGLLRATLPTSVALDVDTAAVDAAGDDGLCVDADPVQLEQVLFNLCINARDALGGPGRIGVTLRLAPREPRWHCASCRAAVGGADAPDGVELIVEDDGPGIPADVAERVFDPFFSTKAPGQGSGMGLAMVHGIVHDHGGHLHLDSAPGQGARFVVRLPRAGAPRVDARAAPKPARSASQLHGRVLVVEDDPMVGDFLAERLAGWGVDVLLQRDAVAAADWLGDPSHTVDVLLTDQTMPRLTGLQLAARARAVRPGLPIVLVSGNAEAFAPEALAAAGVSVALTKPVDQARLRHVLQRWLTGSTAGPEPTGADTGAIHAGR